MSATPNIQHCTDCNIYEDVDKDDAFLRPFGDYYICLIDAEARGIDAGEFYGLTAE